MKQKWVDFFILKWLESKWNEWFNQEIIVTNTREWGFMVFIRNNINNLLIICTLCIMFPSELSALDNGKIKGLVLDKVTGNPLPYTNVFLDG